MNSRPLLAVAAACLLAACGQRAALVLDPASERYFEWQGCGADRLADAARQAGYRLEVWRVDPDRPTLPQIESAAARSSPDRLVLPPLLSGRAGELAGRVRAPVSVLAVHGPGDSGPGLELDRKPAFRRLGAAVAAWCARAPDRRSTCLFLADGAERSAELDALWQGYEAQSGPADALRLVRYDRRPDAAELRAQSEALGREPRSLLLLFLGTGGADFAAGLGRREGRLVGERLPGADRAAAGAAGGVDVDWAAALRELLRQNGGQNLQTKSRKTFQADFNLYADYLND